MVSRADADRNATGGVIREEATTKPAEKQRQAGGLAVARPHGDLKLVIAGDVRMRLSVKFREYPKSRRNRPLTRYEARQERNVLPIVTRTAEGSREAVIENTQEGIYVFSVEPEEEAGAKATFTLKIFEMAARERTRKFGARTITGRTVLFKILMPDAILWDDESAFTGSLEDSISETKFNPATGLYWREFRD
ncbi:hypothetical protein L4X63_20115 [Geomonas sp. Red32]|uniref:hypothetical protein n=1 Tax=Geomonas sp. Red32 TaxID=2912856 RepID=UPI00202CF446|nr:hypothetical protein [Geomonas sp. Red32]MCM0083891.1 hypothetical protein [Geomonas sp. Red32]